MAGSGDSTIERRVHRSSDALTALTRLLDAARRDSALETLAVADASGCLVAGAGFWRDCEELAAAAPLMSQPDNDVVPTRLDVLARRSEVRRLSIDGVQILLCAQGEDRGPAMQRAADGCQRILRRRRLPF